VEFTTTDPNAGSNVRLNGVDISGGPSQYPFILADAGTHTFANTGWILETPGNQTISVHDTVQTSVKAKTGVINVTSNQIASFTMTAVTNPVTAGVPFSLSVSNAVDAIGNPASGTINISFVGSTSGIENAPDGTAPLYTSITVTNGSGSAFQTLTRADTNVVLRGTDSVSAATDDTDGADVITVNPGTLDHFTYTTNPAATETAGSGIDVRIEARDVFDNVVDTYVGPATIGDTTGTISEGSAGGGDMSIDFVAGVYNNALANTLFITDAGTGITIDVSDGSATGKSTAFSVQPAAADHFTIVTTVTSPKTAGESIPLRIEARDQYNNVLSFGAFTYNVAGIVLDDADGTANTTINPGTVDFSNGVWEGVVTVSESSPITIRVGLGSGITVDTTGSITINPASLDHFIFTTGPNTYVKVNENIPVVIEARDKYDNIATGFSGTATVRDTTETIYEAPTQGDYQIAFTGGVYSGNFIVAQKYIDNVIFITSGSASGSSNLFTVVGNNVIVTLDTGEGSASAPKVALAGEKIDMFDFTLKNLDPANIITITGFEIYVESSRNSTPFTAIPSSLIEGIYVYDITSGTPSLIGENTALNNSDQAACQLILQETIKL